MVKKVLLVGDSMIDHLYVGIYQQNILSLKTSVPVVDIEKYEIRLGAAAVPKALNIRSRTYSMVVLGKDLNGDQIPTTYERI